jgi:hypothetical protein
MALSADLVADIVAIVLKSDTQPVQALHDLLDLLRAKGLAWKAKLPYQQVGVHYKNRKGLGVVMDDVTDLAIAIYNKGFHADEVHGIAHELVPGDIKNVNFNQEIARKSEGKLPMPDPELMRYTTSSGGHTTAVLRCVGESAPCADPCMSVDGKYNKAKIGEKDAKFATAVDEGIVYTVISYKVELACPAVIEFIESCMNGKKEVGGGIREVEILVEVERAIRRRVETNGECDFATVKQDVLRKSASHSACIAPMFELVRKYSGGAEGTRVQDLVSFAKGYRSRNIGHHFYTEVAHANYGDLEPCESFRFACLKTNYASPEDKVDNNVGAFIRPSDLKSSTSATNKPQTLEANKLINEVNVLLGVKVDRTDDAQRCVDMFECRIVANVFGRSSKNRMSFDSIKHCAAQCIADINATADSAIENPWEECLVKGAPEQPTKSKTKDQKVSLVMEKVNMISLLKEDGYEKGQLLRMKKDKEKHPIVFTLDSIDGEIIKLVAGSKKATITRIALKRDWVKYEKPKAVEDFASSASPCKSGAIVQIFVYISTFTCASMRLARED